MMKAVYSHALLASLLAAALIRASTAGAGERMDLATLTAALRAKLSSMSSIHVKYRQTFNMRDGTKPFHDYEWAEQGGLRFLALLPSSEPAVRPQLEAFDGKKAYAYSWDPDGKKAGALTIGREIGSGYTLAAPFSFLGRRVLSNGDGLLDLMRSPTAEFAGSETFEGRECWKVIIRNLHGLSGPDQVTALLDPEHDFLPAQIDLRHDERDTREYPDEPYRKKAFQTWTIDEFTALTGGATGAREWFPKRVTQRLLLNSVMLEISSAAINEDLPLERFQVVPPDGTRVHDGTVHGLSGAGRDYIAGGDGASDRLVELAARDALEQLRRRDASAQAGNGALAAPTGLNARPSSPMRSLNWLYGSSILLCGLAAFFWYRRNRS